MTTSITYISPSAPHLPDPRTTTNNPPFLPLSRWTPWSWKHVSFASSALQSRRTNTSRQNHGKSETPAEVAYRSPPVISPPSHHQWSILRIPATILKSSPAIISTIVWRTYWMISIRSIRSKKTGVPGECPYPCPSLLYKMTDHSVEGSTWSWTDLPRLSRQHRSGQGHRSSEKITVTGVTESVSWRTRAEDIDSIYWCDDKRRSWWKGVDQRR